MGAAHRRGWRPAAGALLTADLRDVPLERWPLLLAQLRRTLQVGERTTIRASARPPRLSQGGPAPGPEEVVAGGAMAVVTPLARGRIEVEAVRALPDHITVGMRLLCCGLNPSFHSADALVGYHNRSNRFWPAMLAAGLATVDRDPVHLLTEHRIGMTDLVQRPTPRADEVCRDEFAAGIARAERLCAWLQPAAVAIVGFAGWRAGFDRRAVAGWQERRLGGRPVYLMPSTSGLNATTTVAQLAEHLTIAAAGPT